MGLLDKLMFWKEEATELDYDVEGCFTLPSDTGLRDTLPSDTGHSDTGPTNSDSQETTPDQAVNQINGSATKPDC